MATEEAPKSFPKKTENSGVMTQRPSDVGQIKGPRAKVDGGITFPKTIRPGSPSEYTKK